MLLHGERMVIEGCACLVEGHFAVRTSNPQVDYPGPFAKCFTSPCQLWSTQMRWLSSITFEMHSAQ